MNSVCEYRYRLRNWQESSAKYGPCEVCKGHVSEVHLQVEEARYVGGWTHYNCVSLWGHKECLLKSRRGVSNSQPERT